METQGLLLIVLGILLFSLVSSWVTRSLLTLPIIFTVFGWLLSDGEGHLLNLNIENHIVQSLAEITLILVLFTDAARIDLRRLREDYLIPLRMLLFGMPLTILLGALISQLLFPDRPWILSFLLAAILTPTDAALGQSIVTSPRVPLRIRQSINVESGLNDGIALPFVTIFAIIASTMLGGTPEHAPESPLLFTLMQIILGPLAGITIGWLGARVINYALEQAWIEESFQGIIFLSIAFLSYLFAETIGGNGFIAAFVGGLAFGATISHKNEKLFEFMESEGQLLTLLTFLIFGAVMLPVGLAHANWGSLLLAILFLTVVRMLPVIISLLGLKLTVPTQLFLGWSGPRGLASILFALLVLEEFHIPGMEELLSCVVMTVGLSILLHGLSSTPLAEAYGRYSERLCPRTSPERRPTPMHQPMPMESA